MSALAPVAYYVPAKHLSVGEVIIDRHNRPSAITNIFIDDETTVVCKTTDGNWHYFPEAKEVKIAA